MKFWRNISILGILVSLAACTKMESAYVPETISYSVGSYAAATKAESLDNEGITSFRSSAWMHANGSSTGSVFFANELVSKNGSIWEPAHEYYWPKHPDSYINFVSWYDAQSAPTSVSETAISWTNRTIGQDDNIMVAKKAWKQKNNFDHKYFTAGVPTLFKHQLARVTFLAKASKITETDASGVRTDWTVTIKDFHVNGVYTQGTLSLTNTTEPAADTDGIKLSDWTGSWALNGSAGSISGVSSKALNATDFKNLLAATDTAPVFHSVIPQAASGITLSFSYDVTTVTTKGSASRTITETVNVSGLALSSFQDYTGDWAMNQKITYKITINPDTGFITIVPTVDEWLTASSSVIIE